MQLEVITFGINETRNNIVWERDPERTREGKQRIKSKTPAIIF